jgi:hypothetical protein
MDLIYVVSIYGEFVNLFVICHRYKTSQIYIDRFVSFCNNKNSKGSWRSYVVIISIPVLVDFVRHFVFWIKTGFRKQNISFFG